MRITTEIKQTDRGYWHWMNAPEAPEEVCEEFELHGDLSGFEYTPEEAVRAAKVEADEFRIWYYTREQLTLF